MPVNVLKRERERARSRAPRRLLSRTRVQQPASGLRVGRSEPWCRAAWEDRGPRPGYAAGHLVRLRTT